MKQKFTILLWLIVWSVNITFAQTTETFESQTANAHSFVSNSQTFDLETTVPSTTSRFYVAGITDLGYNASDKFLHADDSYGQVNQISLASGTFSVNSLWLYVTGNATQDPGVTSNGAAGSVIFRGKLAGATVFTVTKSSGFATTYALPGNGFAFVDFSTEGGIDNTSAVIDMLEIELSANYDYFAIDDFIWEMAVVPVKLTMFSAKKQHDAVLLNWITASEINNDRFFIERSTDGTSFAPVAEVKGNGNSSKVINYAYSDGSAASWAKLNHTDMIYYRLKQVDFDGKIHVYGTKAITMNTPIARPLVTIAPNPFINELNVSVSGFTDDRVDVSVIDITGKVILTTQSSVQSGNAFVKIADLDDLRRGVYFVSVKGKETSFTQRIVKTF